MHYIKDSVYNNLIADIIKAASESISSDRPLRDILPEILCFANIFPECCREDECINDLDT